MDLELLKTFLAVAEHGGVLAAARHLRVSKQLVSRRLAALEAEVAVELLRHDVRPLALTQAGATFAARCRTILESADEAVEEARSLREEVRGSLRIAAPGLFARLFLGRVALQLGRLHPDLHLQLSITDEPDPAAPWSYDVVIWIGPPPDVRWRVRHLGTATNVLCATPELAAAAALTHPEQLARQRVIHYSRHSGPPFLVLQRGSEELRVRVQPWLETNDGQVTFSAVLGGGGIGSVPRVLAEGPLARGQLVEVLPEWQVMVGPISALYRAAPHTSRRLYLFLDALVAALAEPVLPPHIP